MIASTVSSNMLSAVARQEGFTFEETLPGFKWMGHRGQQLKVGEASGVGEARGRMGFIASSRQACVGSPLTLFLLQSFAVFSVP